MLCRKGAGRLFGFLAVGRGETWSQWLWAGHLLGLGPGHMEIKTSHGHLTQGSVRTKRM